MQTLERIPHEGEVMKCRQSPFKQGLIASVTTSGVINLYQSHALEQGNGVSKGNSLVGKLFGLSGETFSLHWSKSHSHLLASAVDKTMCVWDVNS
jgi:WD40 repeat protein